MDRFTQSINRLLSLQDENNVAGQAMTAQRPRFQALANRQIEGTAPKALTGFNLFQTPPEIAALMAAKLDTSSISRILEPSAGLGRLYEPLSDLRADWVLIEDQRECFKALVDMLKRPAMNRDFLKVTTDEIGGMVDAVIMNPPFKRGTDVKHIKHALDMVRPGGQLVSLCYNGVAQNRHLKPLADTWEVLPEGSFKESNTGASVAMITITKD